MSVEEEKNKEIRRNNKECGIEPHHYFSEEHENVESEGIAKRPVR